MVKPLPSNTEGAGLTSVWGAEIAQIPCGQKIITQKQYCNKFNKDFKNGHIKKKNLIMLRFDKKQHSVKQLSFNKKIN